MSIPVGGKFGRFEIRSPGSLIGSGGMGEVHRAWDPHLTRDVAVKVIHAAFATDPERVRRFELEARAAAAITHPNILTVHDIGVQDGSPYIVSELLEGETLRKRLETEALPVRKAIDYAVQIARGLTAAHAKGVTHRDLKGENLFVTTDGRVKILDFGLAKLTQPEPALPIDSALPTVAPPTKSGAVIGTVGYMAPEQVRGQTVDYRADIFSFGAILYEMLSGRRAFQRETAVETMTAILKDNPPALPTAERQIPLALVRIVERCLDKDRAGRFQSTSDLTFALESLSTVSEPPAVQAVPTAVDRPKSLLSNVRLWRGVSVVLLVVALALGFVAFLRLPETPANAPEMRVDVVTPPTADPISLALSPDGRRLVFVASSGGSERLWLRSLDAVSAQPLPGTEGASYPFWSPDSRSIGFFAQEKLKRIDVAGGAPQVLASASGGRGGTWNRDGVIVFAPAGNSPLYRIPASGGEPVAITKLDPPRQTTHRFPQFLPDGRRLLFSAGIAGRIEVYLGSLDSTESRRLIAAQTAAIYAPSGHLLYIRQGTLVAHRFNASRGELSGDPAPVADPVGFNAGTNAGAFSVSATGMLAYRAGAASRRQLVWLDRSGKELGTLGEPDENNLQNPELSPDGRRVGVDHIVQGNADVWLIETARGVASRFTFDTGGDFSPLWSPDGSRIVFLSNRKGVLDLYQKLSSGAGSEELLLDSSLNKLPYDWSPDGRFILYGQAGRKPLGGLRVLPMSGERKPFPFVNTDFVEREGQFSPDGRWVAYQSNESGRNEIYVQPFPGPGGKWQVSTGGGISPRWRRDGKELFYIAPDGKLMAAGIQAKGETIEAGAPAALFQTRIAGGGAGLGGASKGQYAVAPDGRFLMNLVAEEASATPITLILNWAGASKK